MLQNLFRPRKPTKQSKDTPDITPFNLVGLPLELVDRVIDHLHDDRRSLRAASCAHRILRPASRYHLIRARTIVFAEGGLSKLHRVVNSSPDLAAEIRELILDGGGHNYTIVHQNSVDMMLQLRSVATLHLRSVCFISASTYQRLLYNLPSLTDLRLEGFIKTAESDWDFSPAFSSPQLHVLSLAQQRVARNERETSAHHLSYCNLVRWLEGTPTKRTLQKFLVRWVSKEQVSVAQNLQRFETEHLGPLRTRPLSSTAPISVITLPLDPEGYSVQITMATLRHIHIPSLHTIRLEFHGFRAYGSQIFPPMEVDDPAPEEPLLDVAAFPRLQHIELVFYDLPEVINYAGLAERFAGAASRGVAVKRIHETTLLDLDIL